MIKLIIIASVAGLGYFMLAGDDPIVEVSARVPACEDAVNKEACAKALKAGRRAADAGVELAEAVKELK